MIADLIDEMQLAHNKMGRLNAEIAIKRISAQPEGLIELQKQWADECVRFTDLIATYKKEMRL